MKKRVGKLSLSRETVRNLLTPELGQAAGGTFPYTFQTCQCISEACTGFPTSAGRLGCEFACIDPVPPTGG